MQCYKDTTKSSKVINLKKLLYFLIYALVFQPPVVEIIIEWQYFINNYFEK